MVVEMIARGSAELMEILAELGDPVAVLVWVVGAAITAAVVWKLELM